MTTETMTIEGVVIFIEGPHIYDNDHSRKNFDMRDCKTGRETQRIPCDNLNLELGDLVTMTITVQK